MNLDSFARGYVEAMFFTNGDIGDDKENRLDSLGMERLTKASVAAIANDCAAFLRHIMPDGCTVRQWLDRIDDYSDEQAGRDFWFTRQGHGVGFWDRETLNIDLFASIDGNGWQLRNDEIEQGPCMGQFGELLSKAANSFGEKYVYVQRGWIYYP